MTRFLSLAVLCMLLTSAVSADLAVQVWPDRLQVRPGEPVQLQITVTGRPAGATAAVECRVVNRLDHEAARFTGPVNAEGKVAFTFRPTEEFGYGVLVTANCGEQQAQAYEVFACAQNPYLAAVDYGFGDVFARPDMLPDGTPNEGREAVNPDLLKHIEDQIARNRFLYRSVLEISCSYSPFVPVVPPTSLYFKGYHYFSSASAWRTLNRRAHENGMYTVNYVAIFLQALGGSEFMRRHPEYISFTRDGSLTGEISTITTPYHLAYYRNYPASVKQAFDTPMYTPGLRGNYPDTLNTIANVTDLEAVKLGVQSYLEGKEFFGYDGVRFDGHYLVPALGDPLAPASAVMDWQGRPQPTGKLADELSARNMRYALTTSRKQYPNFMFGFNDASLRPDQSGDEVVERAVSKVTYPGSYILDEVAKGALVSAAPDNRWEDLIRIQGIQADRARRLGAFLYSGWPPGPGQKEVDTRQIKAVGWALGTRWISGQYHPKDAYFRLYNQFAMRYGQYLLSNDRERLPATEVERHLTVQAERPVWYKDFAFRLRTDHGRYFTVSLLNAPLEERLTADAAQPPPATQVAVTLGPELLEGQAPRAVWALNPDAPEQAQALAAKTVGGKTVVQVPDFPYWTVLVVAY